MDKNKKLMSRPIEEGTKILNEALVLFDEIPALMELWSWAGISATSVVFLKEDLFLMSQDQIIDFVFKSIKAPRDPKTTFKESGDYVFVNFDFKTPDYD
jgi:hypothetical protein